MMRIQRMVERVCEFRCPQCWLINRFGKDPNAIPAVCAHPYIRGHSSTQNSLRTVKFPAHIHWPVCYGCWVTFEPPCNHPKHTVSDKLDYSKCPRRELLLEIIALILTLTWGGRDFFSPLVQRFAPDSSKWDSEPKTFIAWLELPTSTADVLPNHLRFLLAFDDAFPPTTSTT